MKRTGLGSLGLGGGERVLGLGRLILGWPGSDQKTPGFLAVPPGAQPPTWARPVVVEAAVPGETAGLVTEAYSINPVQPPAAGEAGRVPARTATADLCAASQGPGPQPRQSAQHHPQGPHGQRCGDTCKRTQPEPPANARLLRQPQPPPSVLRPSAPPFGCPGCAPARPAGTGRVALGPRWDAPVLPATTRPDSRKAGARTARPRGRLQTLLP